MDTKRRGVLGFVLVGLVLASCGGKDRGDKGVPASVLHGDDAARVQYVMRNASADSLARFIIYGALGRNGDMRIDTLATATNYAYEHLQGDSLDIFAREYDALVERLPLADKMKIYALAGTEDPQGLGYKLGLEYVGSVRDGKKSVKDVDRELEAFRRACGSDTATYRRFMIGFKTVLKVDAGRDVPREVVEKYGR